MDTKLIVSASPHLRRRDHQSLMANVIVALCPAWWPLHHFWSACLLVTAVSVVACVAFEWLYCKLLKKPNPSATCPLWSPASFWP